MEPWDTIILNLENFIASAWDMVMDEVKENEKDIIELNTNRIYNESTDTRGNKLSHKYTFTPIYSDTYKKIKEDLGKYRGKIDLSLTGEYLDSYEMEINGTKVTIKTNQINERLSGYIESAYGEVEGLTDEQWEDVGRTIIIKRIISEILKGW